MVEIVKGNRYLTKGRYMNSTISEIVILEVVDKYVKVKMLNPSPLYGGDEEWKERMDFDILMDLGRWEEPQEEVKVQYNPPKEGKWEGEKVIKVKGDWGYGDWKKQKKLKYLIEELSYEELLDYIYNTPELNRVKYKCENLTCGDYGKTTKMPGFTSGYGEVSGHAVCWLGIGGNDEKPIAIMMYLNALGELVGYIPKAGNCYNKRTDEAYKRDDFSERYWFYMEPMAREFSRVVLGVELEGVKYPNEKYPNE